MTVYAIGLLSEENQAGAGSARHELNELTESTGGAAYFPASLEGIDAIASRTLKDLLLRLTERGLTVFLTSHVLEIVERLCSDIAIISTGKLLASGSLSELKKGIRVEGDASQVGGDGARRGPISLEDYFIHVVGGVRDSGEEEILQWLG